MISVIENFTLNEEIGNNLFRVYTMEFGDGEYNVTFNLMDVDIDGSIRVALGLSKRGTTIKECLDSILDTDFSFYYEEVGKEKLESTFLYIELLSMLTEVFYEN
ncbi:MAG: hypothetical protein ACRCX2_38160 [Paraclostridium sp.]